MLNVLFVIIGLALIWAGRKEFQKVRAKPASSGFDYVFAGLIVLFAILCVVVGLVGLFG